VTQRFDFERLDAFKVALDVVAAVDAVSERVPPGRAYMRDQLRRAAYSIPLNLAEGAGEFAPAEKARFYRLAKRSATECAAGILGARRVGAMPDAPDINAVLDLLHREVAMLVTLIRRCGDRGHAMLDARDDA
jgi:four helix bundle protein